MARSDYGDLTYENCGAILGRKDAKKLAPNTWLHDLDGAYAVRLHETNVLTIFPDGRYVLKSGGWQTVTTKDRINRYLPGGWQVCQRAFAWFLWNWETKHETPFVDGMEVTIA